MSLGDSASMVTSAEPLGSDGAADCCQSSHSEAIRSAFCMRKGSELRSHSEVSVVTTIEDDSKVLVSAIASLLHVYAARARDEGQRIVTGYDSPFIPKFSIHDFLGALVRNFKISIECLAVSFIYIDRLLRRHSRMVVTFTNVHRLLLTSVVLAAKFCEDVRYPNVVYASFFGLSSKQISTMEMYLVRSLDWALYVSQEECEECQSLMLQWGDQHAWSSAEMDAQVVAQRPRKSTSRERRPRRIVRR